MPPSAASKPTTIGQYLAQLPADRRDALQAVRTTILKNLPAGYEEGMQYGMIGYFVPHSVHPAGYHCDPSQPLPFVSLASQKNHMAIYMCAIYMDPAAATKLQDAWAIEVTKGNAKKLNMGKSCIRFKKLEDIPLRVIGKAIKQSPVKKLIAMYESSLATTGTKRTGTKKKAASKKKTIKKAAAKQTSKNTTQKTVTKRKAGTKKRPARKATTKR